MTVAQVVLGVVVAALVAGVVLGGGVALDAARLALAMPGLSASRAAVAAPWLVAALVEGGITTPLRVAAFLAQLGHESGSLRYSEELASGAAYEGRRDLGNVEPGDGVKFKGRGPIQLTGRANYEAASRALGEDLVGNPSLAATDQVGFRVAAWFWRRQGLNALADQGTMEAFDAISRRINGGDNGRDDRRRRYVAARAALGVPL